MATPGPSEAEPPLSESQQATVTQFIVLTAQDHETSVAFLRRSGWSVTVAVSKFFDGEEPTPDLDALPQPPRAPSALDPQPQNNRPQRLIDLGDPLSGFEPTGPPVHDVFEQAIYAVNENNRRMAAERTEVARRIVVPPPAPVIRPSFFLAFLLSPFHLGYRLLAGIWRAIQYVLGLVPGFVGFRRISSARAPRRQLNPRDAASRFKREFEEATGSKALPFVEMGYTQAFDKAKTDPLYLLIVLLAPEHDDTKSFSRDTLLHPDVVEFIKDPANHILLWGGSVRDPEAFQVSIEHRVTKFPFAALICVTPKEGGSTRMGTVKRVMGLVSAQYFATQLRLITHKYADDLAAVRAVRVSNEATRNIRIEQDNAYERSLARDRERARQRQEAERRAREKEAEAARQKKLGKQWRVWRTAHLAPEPAPGATNIVRVALKLPESRGGERVRRSFADDATVEDLYAFVECYNFEVDQDEDNADDTTISEKAPTKPAGYTHDYKFRIASMMPREVHEPSETKTLLEAIGKSASLVVEEVEDSESGEDSDGEEDANGGGGAGGDGSD